MRLEKHHLLYFGPLTVLIEWVSVLFVLFKYTDFNPNNAISTMTMAADPWPLVFGLTITLVSITYALFTLPLRSYSPYIPILGIAAGIAFIITGWTPFTSKGGIVDVIHNVSSFLAVAGYTAIVVLMRKHPKRRVSEGSRIISGMLLIGIIAAFISIYITHRYLAFIQLFLLVMLQTWSMLVVWHELKPVRDEQQD